MASLVRLAARRQMASGSSLMARVPHVRCMHASQPLDPITDQVQPPPTAPLSHSNVGSLSSAVGTSTSSSPLVPGDLFTNAGDHVHVRMAYLHSSTKDPPAQTRAGDLKTGRIRPDPLYIPLSKHVFATETRRDIIHASVIYTLDGMRQGTASTKTRGEVNFSSRKLRPQKGTGSARLGTRGSPLLRKGGVAHGPKPRDMSSKLNRRVRELATRSVLSLRWRTGDLHVVKSLHWESPPRSTRPLFKLLSAKQWNDVLFLTAPRGPVPAPREILSNKKPSAADPEYTSEQIKEHATYIKPFYLSMRNLPRTNLIELHKLAEDAAKATLQKPGFARKDGDTKKPAELHAYEILKRKTLVCDLGAIEWLEEKYGGAVFHELDVASRESAQALTDVQLAEQLDREVAAAGDEASEAAASVDDGLKEAAVEGNEEVFSSDAGEDAAAAEEENVMRDYDEAAQRAAAETEKRS